MARRRRAAVACTRCKSAKIRCSDFRPCKQCSMLKSPCLVASSVTPLNTTMSAKDVRTVAITSQAAMGASNLSSNGAHSLCHNTERRSLAPFNFNGAHRPSDLVLPIAQDSRMHETPPIAQPSMIVGPGCLPHPVAALLCALTLPVPHPPPPPNALSILLAMASAAAPPPSWQPWRE